MPNHSTREAELIIPAKGNHDEDLTRVLVLCQEELVDTFGGCTVSSAIGFWKNEGHIQQESVFRFTVAAEASRDNERKLVNIAMKYGALARQKAIYLRSLAGTVEFLTLPEIALPEPSYQLAGEIGVV